MSGSPVLATPFGSMPELVTDKVGAICRTRDEFLEGIERLRDWRPADCRERVMQEFHYLKMAKDYLRLYQRVLDGESLNPCIPRAQESSQRIFSIEL